MPEGRLTIITDRDIYSPGDVVWMSMYVHDLFQPELTNMTSSINLQLTNPDEIAFVNKEVQISEGHAESFLMLPTGLPEGNYAIKSNSKQILGQDFSATIQVRKRILPRFLIKASIPDKEYIPGDMISLKLNFNDLYSEPYKSVEYQVTFYDGKKQLHAEGGKTRKTDQAMINLEDIDGILSRQVQHLVQVQGATGQFGHLG